MWGFASFLWFISSNGQKPYFFVLLLTDIIIDKLLDNESIVSAQDILETASMTFQPQDDIYAFKYSQRVLRW